MKKNHLKLTSISFALLAVLVFLQPASAQIRNQVFVGTRPLSMGEAFVAVADDGNAIYWNPAGLARMERIQANFAYADLFGLGIKNYYASFISRVYFIPPLTDYLAFGVDWTGFHTDDDELDFSQDQINLALALTLPKRVPLLGPLSIGGNFKYLKLNADLLNGSNPRQAQLQGDGWGWDVGVLYDIGALPYVTNGFQIGLMIHNLGDGLWVKNQLTESSSKVLHENLRWGLSYRPFSEWPGGKVPVSDPVLALDFDDRVHVGLEFWLAKTLALRAGWQKDWRTNEKASYAFGVGFKRALKDYPEVRMDYALTDTPVLPNTTRQFGGSLLIKDNPRAIRIVGAQIENVFASLYRHYEQPGFGIGSIKLKNVTDQAITAGVTFKTSGYSQPQAADTVRIPAGGAVDFPLRAIFSPHILEAPEGRLTGEVRVTYHYRRAQHATTEAVEFSLFGKNFLTWDDPAKAAAFVTVEDTAVRKFAADVVRQEPLPPGTKGFFTDNMISALRLFEAMRALKCSYVPDQTTKRALIDGKKLAVDRISYPAELLASSSRSGDCDDLAVLFATLLESVGVETALLVLPDHVFTMFNTGIPLRRLNSLPVDTTLFVPYSRTGTLWMPVETTETKSSFLYAWVIGAQKYQSALANKLVQIVEIAASREYYPAAPIVVKTPIIPMPLLASRVAENMRTLSTIMTAYLLKYEERLQTNPDNYTLRNTYAAILAQNSQRDKARLHFDMVLQKQPRHAGALNNLANLEFVEGHFERAESLYTAANQHNVYNKAGTYLNLAFLYEMMIADGNKTSEKIFKRKSVAALTDAGRWLNNDGELALFMLGLPSTKTPGKGSGPERKKTAPEDTSAGAAKSDSPASPIQQAPNWRDRISNFISKSMEVLLSGQGDVALPVIDRAGAKRRGEVDEDRTWLLWWSA